MKVRAAAGYRRPSGGNQLIGFAHCANLRHRGARESAANESVALRGPAPARANIANIALSGKRRDTCSRHSAAWSRDMYKLFNMSIQQINGNGPKKRRDSEAVPQLLHWRDMPRHLQFNPYVLTGYRPLQTWLGCLRSLFYFHNETINILTHGQSPYIFSAKSPAIYSNVCKTLHGRVGS